MSVETEILEIAKGRLCEAAPYLATVFGGLKPELRDDVDTTATDGASFFCNRAWLRRAFLADDRAISAALAHSVAHCLLGHVFERSPDALAADLAAAMLVAEELPEFCPIRREGLFLEAKRRCLGADPGETAAVVVEDSFFQEHRRALTELLRVDDHRFWQPETVRVRAGGASGMWKSAARRLSGGGRARIGRDTPARRMKVQLSDAPARAYSDFLRSYAVTRENVRENPDSFQYAWYAYGLEMFGNVPLLEPEESREERRLEELAIIIDTSASCTRDLTVRFLEETRAILSQEELFFQRFNLHILQCDVQVHRDDKITDMRAFERYIDRLEIVGDGGTDFSAAFAYIDRLIERGEFSSLKGVLYFTDGRGIFPPTPPAYEATFVFLKHRYDAIDVPPWARTLVLDAPPPRGGEHYEY